MSTYPLRSLVAIYRPASATRAATPEGPRHRHTPHAPNEGSGRRYGLTSPRSVAGTIALIHEDEHAPGGTTRVLVRNWEPPLQLPHDVEVIARNAQHLVGDVDHHHVLDADGNLKARWRDNVRAYLRETSAFLGRRHASALILGCTHFEYFTREFGQLLPSIAARGGIVSPSGALAWQLLATYRASVSPATIVPVATERHTYAGFSGDTPPRTTFRALGLDHVTLYENLT